MGIVMVQRQFIVSEYGTENSPAVERTGLVTVALVGSTHSGEFEGKMSRGTDLGDLTSRNSRFFRCAGVVHRDRS
jgi:hypothetical protein